MRLALSCLAPSHAAAAAFRSSISPSSFSLPRRRRLFIKMAPAAATDLGPIEGPEEISRKIEQINVSYTALHEAYEENFWATKMGLKVGSRELRESKRARERERDKALATRSFFSFTHSPFSLPPHSSTSTTPHPTPAGKLPGAALGHQDGPRVLPRRPGQPRRGRDGRESRGPLG